MAQFDQQFARPGYAAGPAATFDEGLRRYMVSVYNYMAAGVAFTGLVAYGINSLSVTTDQSQAVGRIGRHLLTPFGQALYGSPLMWLVAFLPLGLCFLLVPRMYQMSVGAAQISFWVFAGAVGASLSSILLRYTGQSITQAFFMVSAGFLTLSMWGYVTKRDLSGWGTFLVMGLFGAVIASVGYAIYVAVTGQTFDGFRMAISAVVLLVSAGLTAYDTQQIKDNYYAVAHDAAIMTKSAIMGALNLYLDFINMFTSLLSLIGDRD